ncbi:MAG: hypothetical protein KDB23_26150, partial [Planctomycetales bacterium]|nr:hypothetical protein [Planctomycetales bacterium]
MNPPQTCPARGRFFSRFIQLVAVFCVATLFRGSACCDDDFSAELPRIPGRSPQEALQALHVAPGFHAELVASEPLVVDPIAIAFDEDGRLYAVEMRDYSEDPQLNLGRIRCLVDHDQDGVFDTSRVFAEGLSWPTAVTCYAGGVVVAVPPDLIYLKDHDGDGQADERRTLYSGFGRHNVQGMVNTLKWGLDNHIHGATSSTGAKLSRQDAPQTAPLELRGRDFRVDPRTWKLEATSGGGQHGLSFNRWGEKFVCSNSDHIQQILYDDQVLQHNPLASPLPARVSIAADGPQADVFRTSPVEPWRIVRTRLRVSGQVPGPIEGGGRAAGYFTGATGITIYRGHAWPHDNLDLAFVCDVGSNLVHRKRLTDDGVKYRAERIDVGSEFVTSDDIWFRPVQLANAPDGNLYIVDMCRETIEHPASLPPEIKRHLDLTSGRNRGRIFRIVADGYQQAATPQLSHATTAELVALLNHPNGWHRETAARLLYERHDDAAVALLRKAASEQPTAEGYLRILYALASLDHLTSADLLPALSHANPHVRRQALRLAEPTL